MSEKGFRGTWRALICQGLTQTLLGLCNLIVFTKLCDGMSRIAIIRKSSKSSFGVEFRITKLILKQVLHNTPETFAQLENALLMLSINRVKQQVDSKHGPSPPPQGQTSGRLILLKLRSILPRFTLRLPKPNPKAKRT